MHSKAELDIHNLEAVFGAFEMAQLLGKLGTLAEGDVGGLSNALIDVIVCTLEETIKFTLPRNPEAAGVFPPGEYSAFTDAIKQLLIPSERPELKTFHLAGREHLAGVTVAATDLGAYGRLREVAHV